MTNSTYSLILAKAVPFRVVLVTDGFEIAETDYAVEVKSKGFKLRYTQTTC